jgi:hypothetical protein
MLYLADIRVTGITSTLHMTHSAVLLAHDHVKSLHDAQWRVADLACDVLKIEN